MIKLRHTEWTEATVSTYVQRSVFENALVVCDRTSWTGYECDLLVVHRTLRLIDVEVKISRSDFKADAKKAKWWSAVPWKKRIYMPADTFLAPGFTRGHLWPDKVWKHYFALPKEVWDDKLLETCSPASGIILLSHTKGGFPQHEIRRKATPCRAAQPITASQCLDIARLCSLRMWQAYAERDKIRVAGTK